MKIAVIALLSLVTVRSVKIGDLTHDSDEYIYADDPCIGESIANNGGRILERLPCDASGNPTYPESLIPQPQHRGKTTTTAKSSFADNIAKRIEDFYGQAKKAEQDFLKQLVHNVAYHVKDAKD